MDLGHPHSAQFCLRVLGIKWMSGSRDLNAYGCLLLALSLLWANTRCHSHIWACFVTGLGFCKETLSFLCLPLPHATCAIHSCCSGNDVDTDKAQQDVCVWCHSSSDRAGQWTQVWSWPQMIHCIEWGVFRLFWVSKPGPLSDFSRMRARIWL